MPGGTSLRGFIPWFTPEFIEGFIQGFTQGLIEEAARAVLIVLQARGVAVPDAHRERILAQKDPERLERWLVKAAVASSVAEVLDEPTEKTSGPIQGA